VFDVNCSIILVLSRNLFRKADGNQIIFFSMHSLCSSYILLTLRCTLKFSLITPAAHYGKFLSIFPHTYLFTYLLTYLSHRAESSLRIWTFWASLEIPRILWNTKVYYCIYNCPPPVHFSPQRNCCFRMTITNKRNEIHPWIRLSGLRLIPEDYFANLARAA